MKKNDVTVEADIGIGGEGIGKVDGYVVYQGCIIGDTVEVKK